MYLLFWCDVKCNSGIYANLYILIILLWARSSVSLVYICKLYILVILLWASVSLVYILKYTYLLFCYGLV